jgi:hypothetical protein
MSNKQLTINIVLTLSISLTSCNSWFSSYQNPLSINEIINQRNGKRVYIAGEVIRTVPFLKNGAYQLQDDTGKVWILTKAKLPLKGAIISIQGKISYQELPFAQEEMYVEEIDTQPYSVTDN